MELEPQKKMTKEQNLAWAAGLIALTGSFTYGTFNSPGRVPKRYMAFQLTYAGSTEPLKKFRRVLGITNKIGLKNTKSTKLNLLKMQGATIENMMEQLWPYLTEERKEQYLNLDAFIREYNERLVA